MAGEAPLQVKYKIQCRKLAKRNGAIIYAKAGRANPTLVLALPVCRVYPRVEANDGNNTGNGKFAHLTPSSHT